MGRLCNVKLRMSQSCIFTCGCIVLYAMLTVEPVLSHVNHRSVTTPTLVEITRAIEQTTRWEELREKVYLREFGKEQKSEIRRSPEYLNHQFNKLNKRGKRLGMVARIAENVTKIFGKRKIDSVAPGSLPELCRMAGFNFSFKDCPQSARIRRSDGACNNLVHVNRGKAFTPFQRFLPPVFDDGIESARQSVLGGPLPSARTVSANILHSGNISEPGYTAILAHFGQFLDHDLSSSGVDSRECSEHNYSTSPHCMPIIIDEKDPIFKEPCMVFVRSLPSPGANCQPGPRQQLNQITSFLDGSNIYGSSKAESNFLRDKSRGYGLLRSLGDPESPTNRPLLPLDEEHKDCIFERVDKKCGLAGDHRAAEQPGLTALHTLFLRMHNSVASELATLNPSWNDERLFQEARRIVVASWQHIVYTEYLPTLLGRTSFIADGLCGHPTARFYGYDCDIDPSISNVFASAAFRFGHSQVPESFTRLDEDYKEVFSSVRIEEAFFNASHVFDVRNEGLDSLLRGMVVQQVARVDEHINQGLTAHLFANTPGSVGLDLAALNIQRGRDHGLPSYNAWREWCGLTKVRDFDNLTNEFETDVIEDFKRTYRHVDDIDLFVASISEHHVRGAIVGPTLACIIGRQFQRLKFGDRFWYENAQGQQAFTAAQLQEIRKVTMARVICDNTNGMKTIQSLVFREPAKSAEPGDEISFFRYNNRLQFPDVDGRLPGFANVRVPCDSDTIIPRINLDSWQIDMAPTNRSIAYLFILFLEVVITASRMDKGFGQKNDNKLDNQIDLRDTADVKKRSPRWYRLLGPNNKKALNLLQKLHRRETRRPKQKEN